MIVEAKPLHKKKKRLAKQRSAQKDSADSTTESNFIKEFIIYNRYKELKKQAMELKEKEWQEELNTLMANSEVNNLSCIQEVSNEKLPTTIDNNINQTKTTPNELSIGPIASNSIRKGIASSTNMATNTSDAGDGISENETIETIDFIDRTPSPKATA